MVRRDAMAMELFVEPLRYIVNPMIGVVVVIRNDLLTTLRDISTLSKQ